MNDTPAVVTSPDRRFPWYVRLIFRLQARRYGAVLDSARLWARTPRVFAALSLLYAAFDRRSSPVEPALRTLITVRISQINGCAFCIDLNSAIGLRRGLGSDKLVARPCFRESPLFSDREKAALAYAEAVTVSGPPPGRAHFERLREYFDDDGIVELTGLIAFQNLSSKFNAALGLAPQGFCVSGSPLGRRFR